MSVVCNVRMIDKYKQWYDCWGQIINNCEYSFDGQEDAGR